MPIFTKWTYVKNELTHWTYPNYWDAIALCLVLAILITLGWGAKGMATPYHLGESIPISLDPVHLPYYAFRSVLRMGIALICSLLFTLIVGTAAAKNTHAERFLIPLIDILQSVPVLGYLSITVVAFIVLFPNSLLGPECAAIFAIFTAQVWNITLSFYQSLKSIPHELREAASLFHLSAWQRFWRLEVCFAMPGLLWNAMMSMSASWFFVVASEAISVNNQNITLPGIGSYIAAAVNQADIRSVSYAIITMFIVILIYDQLLFRPLNEWINKFKFESVSEEPLSSSWVIQLFQHTKWLRKLNKLFALFGDYFVNFPRLLKKYFPEKIKIQTPAAHTHIFSIILWYILLTVALLISAIILIKFIFASVTFHEATHVLFLGSITALRVIILIILSSFIWVPIGVWIGLRPRTAHIIQPIIQFLASFPINLVYPFVVLFIIKYNLNVNIWISPLMILGAQWYVAFNVIVGTAVIPKNLHQVTSLFNLRGWLWWKRLILPGIFPYYVTGILTASGGAWNASIIAEIVSWGNTKIVASGLGAYITQQASIGDFPRLTLGIAVMCFYVLAINHLLWKPLYRVATSRFKIG